jgi:hypothetical protein
MIKIVTKKVGQIEAHDLAAVSSQALLAGVIASTGDTWTIGDAADYLLAEIARRIVVEDTNKPLMRNLPRHFEAETVLGEAGTDISESIAMDVVALLTEKSLVELRSPGSIPPPLEIEITSTGLQRGMALIGRFAETRVPASDRLVTLNHNDPVLEEIRHSLDVLREKILQANDIGDMTEGERDTAVTEVIQLNSMLSASQVRIAAVVDGARGTLRWIADRAGGAVIGAMALAILQAICSYFGIL